MAVHFGYIFWGLILVVVDIKINRFDLLPDVIGFALVAVGAGGLVPLSAQFSVAAPLGWILAGLSVFDFVEASGSWVFLGLVRTGLDCAMMWTLLGGVKEYTLAKARVDLAEQAEKWRAAYVILLSISMLLAYVARGSGNGGTFLLVILVLGTLAVTAMILQLIYRVRHELASREDGLWDEPSRLERP